jgi:hypothetical protein
MDPVNPWLDPSEVRHLAEQLLRPVAPARLSAADPGFDASFVGFTSGAAVHVVPEEMSPARIIERQVEPEYELSPPVAAAVSQPAEVPEPPPTAPSRTRFLQRVYIFRDWLAKNFKAKDIFILDREGKVIFDESGHGRLHFMARNLAIASRGSGNIHVKIGPSAILEVIPCETPYGRIVLGALVPDSLPADHIQTITEVLIQTASPA